MISESNRINGSFVYILECRDGSYYTGMTCNLKKRLREHNHGLCKYTRGRLPVKIIYTERFGNRKEAAQREYEIKGWRRQKKKDLVLGLH